MDKHTPYENLLKRKPDFVVRYEINLADKIKNAKPHQGMRVDFLYEGDNPATEGAHIVWPEILNNDGSVLLDSSPEAMPTKGLANMWVIFDERRAYHHDRLTVGTKGYWWRGGIIANVEVIKIMEPQY